MLKSGKNRKHRAFRGKVVFFATGNVNKYNEARNILSKQGIALGMLRLKGDEIQSENLKEIAEKSVMNAYRQSKLPIFVEDAGLFINALNGFPGPYAAYVYKTIHNCGVIKLMEREENRKAFFQSVIAFYDERSEHPLIFFGKSEGEIAQVERREKNKSSFGFDPIFKPEGSSKTFAEMAIEEKNDYSHRSIALKRFVEWYKQNR